MIQGRPTIAALIHGTMRPIFRVARRWICWLIAFGVLIQSPVIVVAQSDDAPAVAASGVPIDVNLAIPVTLSDSAPWQYVADATPVVDLGIPTRVAIPADSNGGSTVERILLLPASKRALVVCKKSADVPQTVTYVCNLEKGQVDAVVSAANESPICVSQDGTRMLCRNLSDGGQKPSELTLYSLRGGKANPLVVWKPYGPESEVAWAAIVDNDHILTLSEAGALALWEVPELRAIWTTAIGQTAAVALSGGSKTLAVVADSGVKLVSVADGRVVGVIPTPVKSPQAAAFSDDGKRLAVLSGTVAERIRVWNLTDGDLERDFGLATKPTDMKLLAWVDANHLLVGGAQLVDVDRRLELWRFTNASTPSGVSAIYGGRLWFMSSALSPTSMLESVALPTRQSLDAAERFTADDLLVLKPGTEVSIDLKGEGDLYTGRQALTKQINENEFKIASKAPVRFVGEVRKLPAQSLRVRSSGGAITDQEFNPRLVLLSIFVGKDLVWQRSSIFGPTGSVQVRENESIEQALERVTNADLTALATFELPRYLARIP
jgi:hypothetical protein